MIAYDGKFKKIGGEDREMLFAKLSDLPNSFIAAKISTNSKPKQYAEGMELVYDLEENNFRVFNYNTAEYVNKIEVDETKYLDF